MEAVQLEKELESSTWDVSTTGRKLGYYATALAPRVCFVVWVLRNLRLKNIIRHIYVLGGDY